MKIQFMGAAGTVTGSSYILTSGSGESILIDLGMFQGVQEIERLNYKKYEYDVRQLSGAVLTHAHLDHCGRLPILYKNGYSGDIWMTPATKDLTELSLYDSAKIAKKDKKTALYDKDLVTETISHARTVGYRKPFEVGDFRITFRDAGHLLGAASLEIEDLSPDSEYKKIVFSGDLGNTPQSLLQDTELIESADAVVMESTYGDSLHDGANPSDVLQTEINAIEESKSVLMIPAFSLERTQELLHLILHLKAEGKIAAQTPVFMDSPMAEKATHIYLQHTKLFNDHIQHDLETTNPFDFAGLHVSRSVEDSEAILTTEGAKVILAGGGMMTGGRIVGHAATYLPEPRNRLLFVGYQGDETLGRQIQEGATVVTINGISVAVRATINSTRSLSSHADQRQLMNWLRAIQGVRTVILTHGEEKPRKILAQKINDKLQKESVHTPAMHEEILL